MTHEETERVATTFPLLLACDNWQDPRNVGMVFRLADAFGVAGLILGGDTPTPPNRKLAKAARSTHQWVPFTTAPDLVADLRNHQANGYRVIGLEITSTSVPLPDFQWDPTQQYVLVAGNEADGLQPAILDLLNASVHVPMYGRNSSMNVATALAAALYGIVTSINKKPGSPPSRTDG